MSGLKALSIRQPWMDMILRGVKIMDVRPWELKYKGIIALYAPWQIDFSACHLFGYPTPWTLARGKLVGTAEVEQVVDLNEANFIHFLSDHRQVLPLDGIAFGIVFKNVRLLKKPIAYTGRQMLFPVENTISKIIIEDVS